MSLIISGLGSFSREEVVKIMSKRINSSQLLESMATILAREDIFNVSTKQTISYLENKVAAARNPEQKIRLMQHLIIMMVSNIRKKHCQ